jgi:hypothetical protein
MLRNDDRHCLRSFAACQYVLHVIIATVSERTCKLSLCLLVDRKQRRAKTVDQVGPQVGTKNETASKQGRDQPDIGL